MWLKFSAIFMVDEKMSTIYCFENGWANRDGGLRSRGRPASAALSSSLKSHNQLLVRLADPLGLTPISIWGHLALIVGYAAFLLMHHSIPTFHWPHLFSNISGLSMYIYIYNRYTWWVSQSPACLRMNDSPFAFATQKQLLKLEW